MADQFLEDRKKEVSQHKILLYIKGTKEQPQCGFSAAALQIFNRIGKPYETINVLTSPDIRRRMEEFSQWPTFPQIFVGGEFVGGCDIVTELYENGELEKIVNKAFGETAKK